MTRLFLANNQFDARLALRLLLLDLHMQVVDKASTWTAVLNEAARMHPHMLVVAWELIPPTQFTPGAAGYLPNGRCDCSRKQAASLAGTDSFISKAKTPDRATERLQAAVTAVLF